MSGSRDYPEWWLQTFYSWEPPLLLVACCGQSSVCKPYHRVLACTVVLKITMIMCQAQVLEADFQLLPPEASPARGPLMRVKWNPVLLSLFPQQRLFEVPAPGSRARRVPGVRGGDFFAVHLKAESGGISATALCCFCWYAGTCSDTCSCSVLVLFPHFCYLCCIF